MRIALAVCLAFAALWFVALKPKPVDVGGPLPPAAPAKKDRASTPAKADKVVKTERKAEPKKAEPATKPAARKLTGSKAVIADVKAGRTVVLLFFHPSKASADDVAVRDAVRGIDRHDGKVRVHTASLGKLGRYEAITKTAKITSTPTVLVIDRKARVRSIEGLTVTREIDAVVDRALKLR